MNSMDAKRVIETALICAPNPLTLRDLRMLVDEQLSPDTIKSLLLELQHDWSQKGLELVQVAMGWRFQKVREASPVLPSYHGNFGHHCLSSASHTW